MENRAAAWTLIGVVVGLKAWAVLIVFLFDPSAEALLFMLAMNWPIIALAAAALAVPAAFWLRLVRVRAKRRRLQWQEWHVDDAAHITRQQ